MSDEAGAEPAAVYSRMKTPVSSRLRASVPTASGSKTETCQGLLRPAGGFSPGLLFLLPIDHVRVAVIFDVGDAI
jgi:hypothetical protein